MSMGNDIMIKTKDINKSFGSLEVLKGISLEVKKGEIVSIIGPSGAGKTTLMKLIMYLYFSDSNNLYMKGVTKYRGINNAINHAPL